MQELVIGRLLEYASVGQFLGVNPDTIGTHYRYTLSLHTIAAHLRSVPHEADDQAFDLVHLITHADDYL
jgi:hypothetical protein